MARPRRPKTFGQTVRTLREQQGLGLRALASAAHISATYLSQLERDQSKPSERVVFDLATALAVDADELLAMTGRIAEDVHEIILQHPGEISALLLALQDLPASEIANITNFVNKRRAQLGLDEPVP
jgi:putative DNA methylase